MLRVTTSGAVCSAACFLTVAVPVIDPTASRTRIASAVTVASADISALPLATMPPKQANTDEQDEGNVGGEE